MGDIQLERPKVCRGESRVGMAKEIKIRRKSSICTIKTGFLTSLSISRILNEYFIVQSEVCVVSVV